MEKLAAYKSKVSFINYVLTAVLIMFLLAPSAVMGQDKEESAGNVIFGGASDNVTGLVDRDVYSFAQQSNIVGASVGRSAIIAAYNANIQDSTVGDSLRGAARTINIVNTAVDNNITVSGNTVTIGPGTTANAVYAFANTMNMAGTANYLLFFGDNITISGHITGDAEVTANNVIIESGAIIDGNLTVYSDTQPNVQEGAVVGNVIVTEPQSNQVTNNSSNGFMDTLTSIGYWIIATAIIGFLMLMFADPAVNQAALLARKHPMQIVLCGIIGLIVTPILLLLLFIPVVTIPASVVLLVLYGVCLGISVPFTAVSLGRVFLPMVLPELNKWLNGLISLAAAALLSRLPFIGGIVLIASHVFFLGYIVLALYNNMLKSFRSKKVPENPKVPEEFQHIQNFK